MRRALVISWSLVAALCLIAPAAALGQSDSTDPEEDKGTPTERGPAGEVLEAAGDEVELDEPETSEADEDEGEDEAVAEPSEPVAETKPARVPLKPMYANNTFVVAGGGGAFALIFGMEANLQLTIFQDESADPVNRPAPAPFQLRPRSTLLFMAARFYEKFGVVTAFAPTLDPVRAQDTVALLVGFAYANFKPWLRLRAGMLFIPYGREVASYFYAHRSIERSVAMEATATGRDTGFLVEGDLFEKKLDYRLGVITGSGASFVPVEEEPDLVAHLGYRPIPGLALGVSGQIGIQPHSQNGLITLSSFRASRNQLMLVNDSSGLRSRVGADFQFKKGPFAMQAEFSHELNERDNVVLNAAGDVGNGTLDATDVRQMGGYIEAAFFVQGSLKKGIELVVKADQLRTESVSTKDSDGNPIVDRGDAVIYPFTLTNYTAGANYYMNPTTMIQINAIVTDFKRDAYEGMEPPIVTYLDNRTSWTVLTQLRFWIAPPV